MANAGKKQTATEKVRDAERARDELHDALKSVGLQLHSLELDSVTCAGDAPLALIDLGRCNVVTARALAAALRSPDGEQQGAAR
ncbi:hypothetical protein [Streptomyces alkaliterrae]|uniref:Uncharacterized protein n=1 Tax=Streptomyces alkaliterrae TaxID=2213162 RepID=A0A5P0YLD8_9ACTN|nr:hypothetical protein [Streptomyces alkaliterrae]MBB1257957.1 hypothetical protein [Streptomyces alkaliterrae]MQS01163.1 hypothetical protein [Streptomyces alkaliterrae]